MSKGRHGTLFLRDGVGGWGGRWWEGGGNGGGGLCLEETLRAPVPRLSGTLLMLVRYLSRAVYQSFRRPFSGAVPWQGGALRTTITGKDSDGSQRANRVVLTVIIVVCGFSLCPLNPEESHTKKRKFQKCKMSYCSAHHTFRTRHAALDTGAHQSAQLDEQPVRVGVLLLRAGSCFTHMAGFLQPKCMPWRSRLTHSRPGRKYRFPQLWLGWASSPSTSSHSRTKPLIVTALRHRKSVTRMMCSLSQSCHVYG